MPLLEDTILRGDQSIQYGDFCFRSWVPSSTLLGVMALKIPNFYPCSPGDFSVNPPKMGNAFRECVN